MAEVGSAQWTSAGSQAVICSNLLIGTLEENEGFVIVPSLEARFLKSANDLDYKLEKSY